MMEEESWDVRDAYEVALLVVVVLVKWVSWGVLFLVWLVNLGT